MEIAQSELESNIPSSEIQTLAELPIGARLILRCRKDWREAVVSQFNAEKAVLIVASATGKTYRVRRAANLPLRFEGELPILAENCEDFEWRENLLKSDLRW